MAEGYFMTDERSAEMAAVAPSPGYARFPLGQVERPLLEIQRTASAAPRPGPSGRSLASCFGADRGERILRLSPGCAI